MLCQGSLQDLSGGSRSGGSGNNDNIECAEVGPIPSKRLSRLTLYAIANHRLGRCAARDGQTDATARQSVRKRKHAEELIA
jgi:hypothetical protein